MNSLSDNSLPRVRLRPISVQDRDFLYRVYAGTRAEEMALVDWDAAQQAAFLTMQFNAQQTYYMQQYPNAQYSVILLDDEPVGRLYLSRGPTEMRIIDIALLPAFRGRGIGGGLLREILGAAQQSGLPVSIHVERNNPARRLYERLGFQQVEAGEVYNLMVWQPAVQAG